MACGIFSCTCKILIVANGDLSFQTRDQITPPALEGWNLNHWTTREVLSNDYLASLFREWGRKEGETYGGDGGRQGGLSCLSQIFLTR